MLKFVVAHVYEKEVAMTAYLEEGKLLMLCPEDGKVHKYVKDNHSMKLTMDNEECEFEAYVDDNYNDVERVFNLFEETGKNWFDQLSADLRLIVCNVESK